jgi:acetyl esterase
MTPFPSDLSPDMAASEAWVAKTYGPGVDATLLPAAEGRAIVADVDRRWNIDQPAMALDGELTLPADPILGSAAMRVRVLVPPAARPGALLFIHGGGFAFCSPESHERCARVLALESGLPVVVPDYRLSPEHPFPAGLLDSVACFRAIKAGQIGFGVQPGPVLVSGDSAGANLSAAVMLHEQQHGRPQPDGALLFYGVYGADFTTQSYIQFVDGPGLTTGKMRRYWDWYCPDSQRTDPLVAPLLADDAALKALPPLYMMAAGIDPLLSDTLLFVDRLRAVGRTQALTVFPGVLHGFLQRTLHLPEARAALAEAGAAARTMT